MRESYRWSNDSELVADLNAHAAEMPAMTQQWVDGLVSFADLVHRLSLIETARLTIEADRALGLPPLTL